MTSDITQPSRFTALEILDGDPNYRDPTFQIIFPPVFGALAGFYTFALNNWILGRPKYAGKGCKYFKKDDYSKCELKL